MDHHGHAMGHCCLSVRLQDFASLGQLYIDDLVINGKKTVNEDWIGMVENAQAPFQEPQVDAEGNITKGYSFQFWLPSNYDQEFIALGAFDHYLWIDRKNKFVVAQFSTGQSISSMVLSNGDTAVNSDELEAVMRSMVQLLDSYGNNMTTEEQL